MPNDHSKYRIPGPGPSVGILAGLDRDDGAARIHAPDPLAGKPFDLQLAARQERRHGTGGVGGCDSGQDHLPLGCLKRGIAQRGATRRWRAVGHLDHVYPVWQCRVQPLPYLGSSTPLG
jgi:hypothetical protein